MPSRTDRKAPSLSGTHRGQPPSSPSSLRHKSPSSPRIRFPSPRVVTSRGFTSTSTSGLNHSRSYSSIAIRRSFVDRRPPSPTFPSTPNRPRAQQHQRTVSSSSAMTCQINLRLPRRSHSQVLRIPFAAKQPARPLRCCAWRC